MMQLTDEIYEEIKCEVSDLFIEYDIKSTPINAFEIAYKMGLKVIPYSSLTKKQFESAKQFSNDGFSVETQSREWSIYYNDISGNYGRISQTIMHEVGHYSRGHITQGEEEEVEANFFAKYALAPPPLIHKMKGKITIDDIMAKFDISFTAAQNAYMYYKKWLRFGGNEYRAYELKILNQFSNNYEYRA